ncbi:unnamed protein product [Protopolystoma xenopodis]|uniref:Uncharacterized protein n=1 Tax=Protopolystoma xenopodis TaxID=117903 RepID=A0A448WH47_9PLAT|nr:unnamed protein product [Protopolystoma xenopodis]
MGYIKDLVFAIHLTKALFHFLAGSKAVIPPRGRERRRNRPARLTVRPTWNLPHGLQQSGSLEEGPSVIGQVDDQSPDWLALVDGTGLPSTDTHTSGPSELVEYSSEAECNRSSQVGLAGPVRSGLICLSVVGDLVGRQKMAASASVRIPH